MCAEPCVSEARRAPAAWKEQPSPQKPQSQGQRPFLPPESRWQRPTEEGVASSNSREGVKPRRPVSPQLPPNRVSSPATGSQRHRACMRPGQKEPHAALQSLLKCLVFTQQIWGQETHLKVDRNSSHQVTSCVKWPRIC